MEISKLTNEVFSVRFDRKLTSDEKYKIREYLYQGIPCWAISKVNFFYNESNLPDTIIVHRLSLVPIAVVMIGDDEPPRFMLEIPRIGRVLDRKQQIKEIVSLSGEVWGDGREKKKPMISKVEKVEKGKTLSKVVKIETKEKEIGIEKVEKVEKVEKESIKIQLIDKIKYPYEITTRDLTQISGEMIELPRVLITVLRDDESKIKLEAVCDRGLSKENYRYCPITVAMFNEKDELLVECVEGINKDDVIVHLNNFVVNKIY